MANPAGSFLRDASNRLCFEMFDVDSMDYPAFAARVVARFDLIPAGDLIAGLDEVFRDYTDGNCTVGLEWDNWSGFIVTAKSPNAEPLVTSIGEFLSES
ncbi:hypothetical protein RBWH47_02625 [Rhodopirellula baltica WH47]|uniref:Uncharacterized protein n=2 Tax=Rhodopirellula baltica TaxID=265606 RepID=F2AMZ0_RHOBT|nr:hypothetical protein RBWH47_02625 [Rhodopirellula baltica WH47]